jgi:putative transposase
MREPIQKISYKGGYYHIYNRGNRKQNVFLKDADYLNYLERLRRYKDKYNISVVCYCLMPNHFHLLLRQNSDTPIYRFMQALHTSYSMYFNQTHDKVGRMFQGRYKQKEIDKEEYLLKLTSYIHFNPVKDGLVEEVGKLDNYQWSSYPDYIGVRQGTLCDKDLILSNETSEDYKESTEKIKEELFFKDVFSKAVP